MEKKKDIVAIGERQLSSLGEVDLQASPQPASENCLFKVVDINTYQDTWSIFLLFFTVPDLCNAGSWVPVKWLIVPVRPFTPPQVEEE